MLPLLASHGVRLIQVTRRGPTEADGIDVTADSRHPTHLELVGQYTLAHEMFLGGTVPQTCGDRICSQHIKGYPLDTVIAAITQGQPYRHVVGYSADEQARADRDKRYNTTARTGEYPLITWKWGRGKAVEYLRKIFKVTWVKSACWYCPFAFGSKAGRAAMIPRFIADPALATFVLAMEFTATALNPRQGLIRGERLLTDLRTATGTDQVLALFEALLDALPWAVYSVRRALSPRKDGGVNHSRSVRILDTAPRHAIHERLVQHTRKANADIVTGDPGHDDQHPRAWLRHRDAAAPTAEHFLTIAPATAITKTGPAFPKAWAAAN